MGDHVAGRQIVDRAIALSLAKPEMPALEILDQAANGNEGSDAEFESIDPVNPNYVHPLYDDECLLPSPFGELLRRAFAPDLDAREMLFAGQCDSEDPAVDARIEAACDLWWERVIEPFRARYRLC